ncbi:hypothetical protein GY45DRAFT_1315201 [Cubamyces sp. BRFM 1775]|nr:hypothetical protein GY45DRAFT_1315201 [Cubamyces sp. BRFM 1775]
MTDLPGSRLSLTNTGTQTSAQPSPTLSFAFNDLATLTACTPGTITWNYDGPDPEYFSILVSTDISPHPLLDNSNPTRVFDATVAANVDAAQETYDWSPVNMVGGDWYYLEASFAGTVVARSESFLIMNGTDTSCLSPPSSASATSSQTGATTAPSLTATSATTSHTSSAVPIPVSDAVSSHTRTGAIAGGVIGGVAIVAAALAAYIYFGLCRRTPTRSRRRAFDGSGRPGQLGKWGGLSSRDSGMDMGLPVSSVPTSGKPPLVVGLPGRRATTESTGAMLTPLSSTAHGHTHSAGSRGVSDEDVSSIGHEEKVVSGRGSEFYAGIPPSRRRSSASGASAVAPVTPIAEPPSSYGGSYGHNRAKSPSQSHRALALARLDGENTNYSPSSSTPPTPSTARSPPPPPPGRRSIDSMQLRTFDAPPVPMQMAPAVAAQMNRTSSGNGPRRAARKPVPTLTEADMTPPSSATTPVSTTTPGLSSASTSTTSIVRGSSADSRSPTLSPHPMYSTKSGSGSGSTLRAPSTSPVPGRQHSREDLMAAGMELPNLNHKSSFGDRQVHYIIPDLPPPPPQ